MTQVNLTEVNLTGGNAIFQIFSAVDRILLLQDFQGRIFYLSSTFYQSLRCLMLRSARLSPILMALISRRQPDTAQK